jgi:hypothetical protein
MTSPTVYFIQPVDGGPIKVGIAVDVEERLRKLQMGNWVRLRIIATCPGGRAQEKRLHKEWRKHRVHGEWFSPVREVMAWIAEYATPYVTRREAAAQAARERAREIERVARWHRDWRRMWRQLGREVVRALAPRASRRKIDGLPVRCSCGLTFKYFGPLSSLPSSCMACRTSSPVGGTRLAAIRVPDGKEETTQRVMRRHDAMRDAIKGSAIARKLSRRAGMTHQATPLKNGGS